MIAFAYETEIGKVTIFQRGDGISRLVIGEELSVELTETPVIKEAARQLNEYLAGRRFAFDIPLALEGTPFMRDVWRQLTLIPYGETRSYSDIARAVGNQKAARAVGLANNRNPVAIFVPCHRVIGSSGSLTGYRWGLDIKEKLLSIEKANYCL